MVRKGLEADIPIEADIRELANNPSGFEEGSWIPYLTVKFVISKLGTRQRQAGEFMAMVANDDPHYGDDIRLVGAGKDRARYVISQPGMSHGPHFGRHTDRETGVRLWFKAFEAENGCTYAAAVRPRVALFYLW